MKKFLAEKFQQFRQWVSSHGGATRVGQGAIAVAVLLHAFCPPFAQFFNWLWAVLPVHLKEPLVGLSAFYAWTRDPKNRAMVKAVLSQYFSKENPDGTTNTTESKLEVSTPIAQP